ELKVHFVSPTPRPQPLPGRPLSGGLTVILPPGINAPEVSFTVPKMVAVEVCATLRQVPNAINTTRAVANFPTTCRLIPVPVAIKSPFFFFIHHDTLRAHSGRCQNEREADKNPVKRHTSISEIVSLFYCVVL